MIEDDVDSLKGELLGLRQEHRDLDTAIAALQEHVYVDPMQVHRMKKRKLRLKDMISRLEDRITPDIIA
jgi:hypothetical protein